MTIDKNKLSAQLRAAKAAIENLQAELNAQPNARLSQPERVSAEFADSIAIQSATIAGLLLDGMAELVTGDQFDIEDELSSVMQRQIKAADFANTPVHIEAPKGIDYRAKELGVGGYA